MKKEVTEKNLLLDNKFYSLSKLPKESQRKAAIAISGITRLAEVGFVLLGTNEIVFGDLPLKITGGIEVLGGLFIARLGHVTAAQLMAVKNDFFKGPPKEDSDNNKTK